MGWPAEALEAALYDSQALQGFARIDLAAEGVPDATTRLKFRRLLETHDSPRRPPPRTRKSSATPKCTSPKRAATGISG